MNYTLTTEKIAIILFFIMFIYSGFNKIFNFSTKTEGLAKRTNLPYLINEIGMLGVILLEIIGSFIIIYFFFGGNINKEYVIRVVGLFLLFLIVVTFLYHPPTDKIIPFLSNVTTFSGLLLIYDILDN